MARECRQSVYIYVQLTTISILCHVHGEIRASLQHSKLIESQNNAIYTKQEREIDNRDLVFKATFNNISVISWRSVLLAEQTGILGENQRPASSH